MKPRRRDWFHCTQDDHGASWVAARITPSCIGSDEPRTPRLCVAADVASCLSAKWWCCGSGDVQVYRTAAPRVGIRPVGVWDATLTGEQWIVPPVEMVRVGVLPIRDVCSGLCRRPGLAGLLPIDRAEQLVAMHAVVRRVAPEFWDERKARFADDVLALVRAKMPRPEPANSAAEAFADEWEPEEAAA